MQLYDQNEQAINAFQGYLDIFPSPQYFYKYVKGVQMTITYKSLEKDDPCEKQIVVDILDRPDAPHPYSISYCVHPYVIAEQLKNDGVDINKKRNGYIDFKLEALRYESDDKVFINYAKYKVEKIADLLDRESDFEQLVWLTDF